MPLYFICALVWLAGTFVCTGYMLEDIDGDDAVFIIGVFGLVGGLMWPVSVLILLGVLLRKLLGWVP